VKAASSNPKWLTYWARQQRIPSCAIYVYPMTCHPISRVRNSVTGIGLPVRRGSVHTCLQSPASPRTKGVEIFICCSFIHNSSRSRTWPRYHNYLNEPLTPLCCNLLHHVLCEGLKYSGCATIGELQSLCRSPLTGSHHGFSKYTFKSSRHADIQRLIFSPCA
jgi:hypothetical protein